MSMHSGRSPQASVQETSAYPGLALDHPADVPIRRVRKAFEQVADHLRELIVTGVLLPGQRLPTEHQLAERFGVSRATVREALRLLSAQSLVRTAKGTGGGSYVNVPTVATISELMTSNLGMLSSSREISLDMLLQARELIEVPASQLAAQHRTNEDLAALVEAVPRDPLSFPVSEQFVQNRDFHFRLVEAAGNPLLSIAAQPIFRVLQTHMRRAELTVSDQLAMRDDHGEILRALETGDADAAGAAMRRHLEVLRPAYERGWRAMPT